MSQMIAGFDYVTKALFKGSVFDEAVVANTDIFDSDLEPTGLTTTFRIYACFDAASVLTVRRTSGATTVSEQLNSGVNLTANAAYMFDIIVRSGEAINLRYGANATCFCLKVVEVTGVIS